MSNSLVWSVAEHEFPRHSSENHQIEFLLRYAILAPSAHNTQPWRWQINGNELVVYRDQKYTLRAGDPTLRETFLSLGAFIENFVVAAAHFGLGCELKDMAFQVSDLQASKIVVSPQSESHLSELFEGITKRHTNRGYYKPDELSQEELDKLQVTPEAYQKVFFITDAEARERIANLVGRGTYIALSMDAMRHELAELVYSESSAKDTGMAIESMLEDANSLEENPTEFIAQNMDVLENAKYWETTFASSPLHIVIGSEIDGPLAWINAGRTMERILLAAAATGMTHCISAAPVEVPTLAPLLRKEIDEDVRPQVLIRVGYPENPDFTRMSGRRKLD